MREVIDGFCGENVLSDGQRNRDGQSGLQEPAREIVVDLTGSLKQTERLRQFTAVQARVLTTAASRRRASDKVERDFDTHFRGLAQV